MIEIPKSVEDKVQSSMKHPIFIIDGKLGTYKDYRGIDCNCFVPTKMICGCEEGKDKVQEIDITGEEAHVNSHVSCKYCNSSSYNTIISSKAFEPYKTANRWGPATAISNHKSEDVIYFRRHPSEVGIECYVGYMRYKLNEKDEENIKIDKEFVATYYASIVPGKPAKVLKILKRSNKEVDLFEAFNINSQTTWGRECLFEGADSFVDFLDKNMDFAKRSVLFEALKYNCLTRTLNASSFFLIFLALNTKYPVLELLIKMGYTKMYFDVIKEVTQAGSKREIQARVKNLEKLLTNSTKGSTALRIPQYIGSYLKDKTANLEEYLYWCDIYELDNLSKENFETIINSSYYFTCLNSQCISSIPDVMKYGYTLDSLLKYLHKYHKKYMANYEPEYSSRWFSVSNEFRFYKDNLNLLKDYLEMCDMMDIEPNLEPSDIKTIHDRVAAAYKAKENEVNDEKLRKLADSISRYIEKEEDKKSKMDEEYEIVFPRNTYDFIKEGQQQHNCVGSYYRSVLDGRCVIFFVRKKDDPEESYITGEYRNGHLGQLMYKNNMHVVDKNMRDYCTALCNKIKRGISSGKIESYAA